MSTENKRQGLFQVIESFAIKRRNEFYLIGQLKEGSVQKNWFVNVPLNRSLYISVRIKEVEEVEMPDGNKYTLLIIHEAAEDPQLMLSLNIGNEELDISVEGLDF